MDLISYINNAKKKTPVKLYINEKNPIDYPNCTVFGSSSKIVFGDYSDISKIIDTNKEKIRDYIIENDCRNSAIPLLDYKNINARIEPGAIIRERTTIHDNAVIMMGAIINIGAIVGEATMIDMGAVLGARAIVGKNCHIGANAVLAGVIEPPSNKPVIIEDDVLIGANAVVIEGIHVEKGAVIAAGAVVIDDVPSNTVVGGIPARILKKRDEKTDQSTLIITALREI